MEGQTKFCIHVGLVTCLIGLCEIKGEGALSTSCPGGTSSLLELLGVDVSNWFMIFQRR